MPVVDVNSNDSDSNSNYVRNGQADNGDGEAGREDVQVPPQHQPFLFRCKIQNVRILVTVLRAISFRTVGCLDKFIFMILFAVMTESMLIK